MKLTVFISVYAFNPSSPSSLPIPEALNPPNGAAASNLSYVLILNKYIVIHVYVQQTRLD